LRLFFEHFDLGVVLAERVVELLELAVHLRAEAGHFPTHFADLILNPV